MNTCVGIRAGEKKKENSFENGLPQFLLQTFRGHLAANQPTITSNSTVHRLQNKPSSLRALKLV